MSERVKMAEKKPETKKEHSGSRIRKIDYSQSINSPVDRILFLQKTIGNQGVQRLIKSRVSQTKPRIGKFGDVHKQETNIASDALMRKPITNGLRVGQGCSKCIRKQEKDSVKNIKTESVYYRTQPLSSYFELSEGKPLLEPQLEEEGAKFGKKLASVLLHAPSHPIWKQVHSNASILLPHEPAIRELPVGGGIPPAIGDPAEKALYVTGGYSKCNLGGAAPIIVNNNNECTRPCTQLHEMKHVADWGACCSRARPQYQAPGANKAAIMAQWNSYLTNNEAWFECRAYGRSVMCANAMNAILLCWAPEWLVRTILVGGGALAGGMIGAQVVGAAGTATGAGAGLAGGPAAPVTVPAGAAAGFITGEMLGFLTGAGIGALLGAGAEALREACCRQVQSYRAHVTAERSANCGASGGTPVCPF